jgi:hypothetical protein
VFCLSDCPIRVGDPKPGTFDSKKDRQVRRKAPGSQPAIQAHVRICKKPTANAGRLDTYAHDYQPDFQKVSIRPMQKAINGKIFFAAGTFFFVFDVDAPGGSP